MVCGPRARDRAVSPFPGESRAELIARWIRIDPAICIRRGRTDSRGLRISLGLGLALLRT